MRLCIGARSSALRRIRGIAPFAVLAVLALSVLAAPVALAQLSGVLGSGQSGGTNALGGLAGGLPSVSQAGPANTAGILQYCIQNNYLSSGVAGSTESALLGQTPGADQSSDYASGSGGLLETGNGQSYNLSSITGGMKAQLSQKICDMVLQHAKSLL
jgi:hypothetical protein